MEVMPIASTNLKRGLILQFPIKKTFVRIGAPKQEVCIVYSLKSFFVLRRDHGWDHCFLDVLGGELLK